jgi:hypothetical protein
VALRARFLVLGGKSLIQLAFMELRFHEHGFSMQSQRFDLLRFVGISRRNGDNPAT